MRKRPPVSHGRRGPPIIREMAHPKPSHEVLRAAVDRVGAKEVAARMGLSLAMIYKWCSEPEASPDDGNTGIANPLDRVASLIECTKDPEITAWLCQAADGFFVPNPESAPAKNPQAVLDHTQRIVREFSDLLDVIAKAMSDGKVDPEEAKRIRGEWEQLKRYAEGFVRLCERRTDRR